MKEYTITITISGGLDFQTDDEEGAEARAKEIADGLTVLAEDIGLVLPWSDVTVEEL